MKLTFITSLNRRALFRVVCAVGMVLVLMLLLSTQADFLHLKNAVATMVGLGTILTTTVYLGRKKSNEDDPRGPVLSHIAVFGLLLIYLSSGITENIWFFMPDWGWEGNRFFESWLFRSLLLTTGFSIILGIKPGLIKENVFLGLLFFVIGACLATLGRETGFEPLYRMDHSSFYYRFTTFIEGFPHPSFYDPNWNGGKPVPYLVASGVWSLALLWYPFLRFMSIDSLYTPMLAVTFMGLVPVGGYMATRLFDGSRRAAWITALLFLVPGQRYFTHILHYGTLPSIFSLSLFALILSLFWRFFHADSLKKTASIACALIVSSALALCWPGAILCSIPLGLAILSMFRFWNGRKLLWLFICAACLVFLLYPLALVPIRYSPINAFVTGQISKTFGEHIISGSHLLGDLLQGIHPLIVVVGLSQLFIDKNRARGRMMGSFVLGSALLAGWGEEVTPLLQWERQIIPATLVCAIAAALGMDHIFSQWEEIKRTSTKPLSSALSQSLVAWMLSLLLLGGYEGYKIYSNRGMMDFQTMPSHTAELMDWLKQDLSEGGRVLIAGRAVHGYGGAKVAAMPLMIGREMISCDYYGFSPKLVEYQCPPRKVLNEGPEGVFRYLEIYNVTHVMTYHQSWVAAFKQHPEHYQLRYQNGGVQVYKVLRENNMLVEGRGNVHAEMNRIEVNLEEDAEQIILKYNWSENWKVTAPAELYPVSQEFDIRLIGIRPHGLRHLTLDHRS